MGGWRLTYRMKTDIPMDGRQRNRWIDGLTDQWTDGLNGWINIWQIDRQMTDGWIN